MEVWRVHQRAQKTISARSELLSGAAGSIRTNSHSLSDIIRGLVLHIIPRSIQGLKTMVSNQVHQCPILAEKIRTKRISFSSKNSSADALSKYFKLVLHRLQCRIKTDSKKRFQYLCFHIQDEMKFNRPDQFHKVLLRCIRSFLAALRETANFTSTSGSTLWNLIILKRKTLDLSHTKIVYGTRFNPSQPIIPYPHELTLGIAYYLP